VNIISIFRQQYNKEYDDEDGKIALQFLHRINLIEDYGISKFMKELIKNFYLI
jgi:hypothetical protein